MKNESKQSEIAKIMIFWSILGQQVPPSLLRVEENYYGPSHPMTIAVSRHRPPRQG